MPTTISEGALEFEFGDEWSVVLKWDDTSTYQEGIHKLQGSKAVDVLAYNDARRELLMLEVKDFRGHRIENRPRIRGGELFDEVGHKVRDTVAGVRGAARIGDDPPVAALAEKIASQTPLVVVLWLAEDRSASARPRAHRHRRKGRLSTMTQQLKRRLRWLTPRALVCSRDEVDLEDKGIRVRSGPGDAAPDPGSEPG